MYRDFFTTYHNLFSPHHHTSTQHPDIPIMAPPIDSHTNYSRPFDLRKPSSTASNTSSSQDNISSSSNKQTNNPSSLSHHRNNENTTSYNQNSQNTNIGNSSMNQNDQITPYPSLRQKKNFHTTSTLRQSHGSITPTPLRQSTTAASLGPIDGGRSGAVPTGMHLVQHRRNDSFPSQSNMNASSSAFGQTSGGGIGGGGGSGSGSSSQYFRPVTPAPYPAIYGPQNQNTGIEYRDGRAHSLPQYANPNFPSQSPKQTQHSRSTSSTQNTNSETHRPTPTATRTGLATTSASPTPSSSRSKKPKRPAIDPRYDPNLPLAQRLEASTDLPLAPFSEYEWKNENEYVNMTTWQPPERHSEEWRLRDLEGWK